MPSRSKIRLTMPKKARKKLATGPQSQRLKQPNPRPNSNGGRSAPTTCMTPVELCRFDDICTGLIVDPYLGFQTHKMNIRFRPLAHQARLKAIVEEFIRDQNYGKAYDKLLAVDPRRTNSLIKSERELGLMRQHIYCFLNMFDRHAGFAIKPCNRYSLEGNMGAKIVATKAWSKGETMSMLHGFVGTMTPEEERLLVVEGKNDYSIIFSSRKKKSQLWLGPAAYMNHDCQPNCLFHALGNLTKYQAIRNISVGDEIVLTYGADFFGEGNRNCECTTCEINMKGAFRPKDCDGLLNAPLPLQENSGLSTRGDKMIHEGATILDNWDSRTGRLKRRKVTRYDEEIIQGNKHMPDISPLKDDSVSVTRSRQILHSRTAVKQNIDPYSFQTSSDLSASCATPTSRPVNGALSRKELYRKRNQHGQFTGRPAPRPFSVDCETGDENFPVLIKRELDCEGEAEESTASTLSYKYPAAPTLLDFATGSATVHSLPRRRSADKSLDQFAVVPLNGRKGRHEKRRLFRGEPVRQSSRLRPRLSLNRDRSRRVFLNGLSELDHYAHLHGISDNEDSGLGGDVQDKSLDSNHNFQDPPVLEPQLPCEPPRLVCMPLGGLPPPGEESDQELNRSNSSIPPLLPAPAPLPISRPLSPQRRKLKRKRGNPSVDRRNRGIKIKIRFKHPDVQKEQEFQQQLDREGRSEFVHIEARNKQCGGSTHRLSLYEDNEEEEDEVLLLSTSPSPPSPPVLQPSPVRLRLRSDKSGTVFQCLSPKPVSIAL